MREIPFVDLRAQYDGLKTEIDASIQGILDQSAFVLGRECREFEAAFAAYVGVAHAVGVCSGTDALEMALRACGIGPGDEVITVANTFIATSEAITHVGAKIRFVDVDERTYNMDPDAVERAIGPSTRALLPVHLYGQPADMDPLTKLAERHGLKVIEDCAQAHGATYRGRQVGTFGQAACFSFYPSKNLGAYGDAGTVVTNHAQVADRVRLLGNHGQREKYVSELEGYCHRLDNLQASVLKTKLPHLNGWNARRRWAASVYDELLAAIPGVITPWVAPDSEAVFHLYVVQLDDRDRVRRELKAAGIDTGIHYPVPLHEQPAYRHLGHRPQDFPVSQRLARRILSLPMYPELTQAQLEHVAGSLKAAVRA